MLGTACWLWIGSQDKDGYGQADIDWIKKRAHRVAWFLETGVMPDGICVLHHCDTPPCVRFDHLFLGTNGTNMNDRDAKGRQARGQRQGSAKLTESQVAIIRHKSDEGYSQKSIADKHGVSVITVNRVIRRAYWKHVP